MPSPSSLFSALFLHAQNKSALIDLLPLFPPEPVHSCGFFPALVPTFFRRELFGQRLLEKCGVPQSFLIDHCFSSVVYPWERQGERAVLEMV